MTERPPTEHATLDAETSARVAAAQLERQRLEMNQRLAGHPFLDAEDARRARLAELGRQARARADEIARVVARLLDLLEIELDKPRGKLVRQLHISAAMRALVEQAKVT